MRRLLARADLPAGLAITEHPRSGRNRLFVVRGQDRSWFVKSATSTAESWFHTHVGPLLRWVPAAMSSPEPGVAVTEYVESPSVLDLAADDPAGAVGVLVTLAPLLAELQALPLDAAAPAARPALPELDPVHVSAWLDSTEASRHILASIQGRQVLSEAVRAARSGLGPRGLIHGDLKVDNILHAGGTPIVVDWELCGDGHVAWDLGSVLGSILAIWIEGMDLDGTSPSTWFKDSVVPYAEICDAGCQLVADYRRRVNGAMPPLSAVVTCAAAWLAVRSWVESLLGQIVNPRHPLRLIVAEGLVRNPGALLRGAR